MSLSDFFKKSDKDKKTIVDESMNWMEDKSQTISKNLVKETANKTEKISRFGHIYQFAYDAKTKSKLKYYDSFPMSIVIEKYKDGFLGINLHYLPVSLRFMFMNRLWEYVVSDSMTLDQDSRFMLRYNMLKTIKGKNYYLPCLKRYLYSQMRTPLYHIPADKWVFTMVLPSSKFFDKNGNTVMSREIYRDSRNTIINNK